MKSEHDCPQKVTDCRPGPKSQPSAAADEQSTRGTTRGGAATGVITTVTLSGSAFGAKRLGNNTEQDLGEPS